MLTPDWTGRYRGRRLAWSVLRVAAVCLLSLPVVVAAAEVDDFVGREVVDVAFVSDGLPVRDDAVDELVETKVGFPLSMREVRESVTHLFSLGRYESVEVEGRLLSGGVALQYALVSLQLIERIEIDGTPGVSAGDLRREITDAHGPSFRIDDVPLVDETIRRFYRERGFFAADVTIQVEGRGASQLLRVTAQAGARATVDRLSVRGVSSTMYPFILARLGLEPGRPYDGQEIERRLREYEAELRGNRYYEVSLSHDIEVMEGGSRVHLVLDVHQGRRISVAFTGPNPTDADLGALVHIEREGSVDEDLLEDADRRISSFLHDLGYRDAVVTHTREVEGDELSLLFSVDAGRPYKVDEVIFAGNASVPDTALVPFVSLGPGDPLVTRELDVSLDLIAEYYRQIGYATVRVEPRIEEMVTDAMAEDAPVPVSLTIDITEDVQTTVRSIALEGNEAEGDQELGAIVASVVGGPYYARRVVADRDSIRTVYLNAGHERAVVSVEPHFDDGLDAVDLVYRIIEGPQTLIDHVLIVGNEQISSSTIRRELALEEGQPLGLASVAETRRRLNEMGLFRRIDIREFSHGGGSRRDVVIIVEEAPATRLGYGGGVEVSQRLRRGTDDTLGVSQAVERIEFAPRGFVQIGRRNLWGKNRSVDLFTRVSVRRKNDPVDPADSEQGTGFGFNEYRILGTYTEPRAFGRVWDLFVTGFIEQGIRPGFDLFSRGVNAEAVRQLSSSLSTSVAYNWGKNDTSNIQLSPEDVPLVDRLYEKVRLSSFSGGLVRDTRDDVVDPGQGALLSVDAKVAGRAIGSEVGFVKSYAQVFLYRRLPGTRRVIVAAGARLGVSVGFPQAGAVIPLPPVGMPGDAPTIPIELPRPLLPISERFFAGGDTTVRGFAFDRLGIPAGQPGATIDADGFPQGGNAVIILNGEIRVPVTRDIGVVGFLDAGNVYDRASNLDLGRIRGGVGFGVRYRSPVGPIRVDLGFKLDRMGLASAPDIQREPLTALHISIGQAF